MNKGLISILILLLGITFLIGCMNDKSGNSSSDDTIVSPSAIEEPQVDSVAIKAKQDSIQAIAEAEIAKAKREQEVQDSIKEVKRKIDEEAKRKAAIAAAKPKPAPKPVGGAKIQFEKTVHDFGTINEGDKIKYEFFFKNTGTKDLLIKDATASCGCTAPGFSFFPIAPGEESAITVNYNSKNKTGPQRPEITVITNASPSKIKLFLEGTVVKAAAE